MSVLKREVSVRRLAGQLVLCCISVSFFSGCVMTKLADYMHEDFDAQSIETVHVLPVLDHRIDQSKSLKLDKWVHPVVERSLKQRGYSSSFHTDPALAAWISRDMLESPNSEFVARLQPQAAKWILLLVLEDSQSKMSFGSTGTAEMSGYGFNKETGEMVWRDKEVGKCGQGGLAGMMVKGFMERSAIEMATTEVLQTIPVREE
ncbi:MAG: hypothetical protein KAU94_11735 [Verrucomicrobia bacterium]|nr:hypothetical protein [Verrucomicrobiota bacterium]